MVDGDISEYDGGKSNLILDLNMEEGKKKRKERREIGKGMKSQKEEKRE